MAHNFLKMSGLGNDFVVIDGREVNFAPAENRLRAIADRKRGIGCDQIIVMRQPQSPAAHVCMEIYNADGSKVRACGNAARCIARLMFEELGRKDCIIETGAGLLSARAEKSGMITVDFGKPLLEWDKIPLAHSADTLHVPLTLGALSDPCCVNMGNPHAVFFIKDASQIPLQELGPQLENDPLFPDRCNIEVAQIIASTEIHMRVWERGAGITEACGTGACATLVAAARRGLSARRASIVMDGGEVIVEWEKNDHVTLTGPAALSFQGIIEGELFTQARITKS
jgi:diaminopimelate epimerase